MCIRRSDRCLQVSQALMLDPSSKEYTTEDPVLIFYSSPHYHPLSTCLLTILLTGLDLSGLHQPMILYVTGGSSLALNFWDTFYSPSCKGYANFRQS